MVCTMNSFYFQNQLPNVAWTNITFVKCTRLGIIESDVHVSFAAGFTIMIKDKFKNEHKQKTPDHVNTLPLNDSD